MEIEISKVELFEMIKRQLSNLFVFSEDEAPLLGLSVEAALGQCATCFEGSSNKYYRKGDVVYFNPFHSGQYSIFLYYLSRQVFLASKGSNTLSDRIYYLNKCLNGLDLYYEVEMPSVFFLDHPVGSVMGRAVYGERFSFSQNCTVGNNKGIFPVFGKNVAMKSGAKVLGKCVVGDNVIFSANSYVKDTDIPGGSIVFGSSPDLVIKRASEDYFVRKG